MTPWFQHDPLPGRLCCLVTATVADQECLIAQSLATDLGGTCTPMRDLYYAQLIGNANISPHLYIPHQIIPIYMCFKCIQFSFDGSIHANVSVGRGKLHGCPFSPIPACCLIVTVHKVLVMVCIGHACSVMAGITG